MSRLVLFDIDGTLLLTAGAGRRAIVAALGEEVDDPRAFLVVLLEWLGRSESPLVVPWLEDLWLEAVAVNLPGTPSFMRPNWQRPMQRRLDAVFSDPEVDGTLRRLHRARNPE